MIRHDTARDAALRLASRALATLVYPDDLRALIARGALAAGALAAPAAGLATWDAGTIAERVSVTLPPPLSLVLLSPAAVADPVEFVATVAHDGCERAGYGLGGAHDLAPGLAVTLYGSRTSLDALPGSRALLEETQPAIVQVHTTPDDGDAETLRQLRALLPDVRVWIGAPANPLARMSVRSAVVTVQRWCRRALEWGVECLVLNGEGDARAPAGDWVISTPSEDTTLRQLAREVLGAARAAAPGLALGWTSHDCPRWHRLPWAELLGAASPVDLHLPQHYAAPARASAPPTGLRGARTRLAVATAQWEALVQSGAVADRYAPGGTAWAPYLQAHGVTVEGTCALTDRAPIAALWAWPRRADGSGATALRALATIRRAVGHAPGAVARWQAAHGLAADGVVGPATLRALGLAP